ncbi:MAG: efflux RND transporter permease subunit [Marinilabiliaceae bacterium]|nr:efflux RND transporter permease subunit [Marinilabiliaceae bacterium]
MHFLLRRPIAVFMAFLALFILGIVAYNSISISLMPKTEIPQITIQIPQSDGSAREIEQSITSQVRRQLLQVNGLASIESCTRDGLGVIEMRFDYGTNIDLAYIEVNEKIDALMTSLPVGTKRPRSVKASVTDVPAFYLNITVADAADEEMAEVKYLDLCKIVENIIRRRIEQLPEVAMADVSGTATLHLLIKPDEDKMRVYGLTVADIDNALSRNNIDFGSMTIRDGELQYNIRMATMLQNERDVADIYMRSGERIIQMKDFCNVSLSPQKESGRVIVNGRRGVSIAVINQSGEAVGAMRDKVEGLVSEFSERFPDYRFEIMRNQTQLLDYTIGNLEQNLMLSFVLILAIGWLFLGDWKSSLTILITLIVAIVLTFIPLYCADKTLNIISLSGLILVIGMMIDNSLIVTENISQWRNRGRTLRGACALGASEMITPLLSSSLTTMAVFIPLVFMSDIASSIFGDQAFVITAGLAISYIVGIILLPVVYHQIFAKASRGKKSVSRDYLRGIMGWYEKSYGWSRRHKTFLLVGALLMIPTCFLLFSIVDKEKMPRIAHDEMMVQVEWGESITIDENSKRTSELLTIAGSRVVESSAAVGTQTFVVDRSGDQTVTEADIYIRLASTEDIESVEEILREWAEQNYPKAILTCAPPSTVFERLFDTEEPDVVVRLTATRPDVTTYDIRQVERTIAERVTEPITSGISFEQSEVMLVNRRALERYGVTLSDLQRSLVQDMKGGQIAELHSYSTYMPVSISATYDNTTAVIEKGSIHTQSGDIPYHQLIQRYTSEELKTISGGKEGEYIPIEFKRVSNSELLTEQVERAIQETEKDWRVSFTGAFKTTKQMLRQLIIVLLISFLLMYFILCAQFESFIQPLIVLSEIPIDIAFALIVLWVCGETVNLMSAIGIIVSCGIIINDSILKIDTINELRKDGYVLAEAVHEAGKRRLRAIVMTSLTTIGAMVPVLFTSDLGSQLQRPLAIAMIATMTLGTLVSLYVVPMFYQMVEQRKSGKDER